MKTAVSIPDPIFRAAEGVAERLKISRSELYARALAEFVDVHGAEQTTKRLNEVYATEPSRLDPVIQVMALTSIERDEW